VRAVVTEDATNNGETVNLCPAKPKHTLCQLWKPIN